MKSRRRVAPRAAPAAATTTIDPRRVFLENILTRIQFLGDKDRMPQDVQDEIRAYSRTSISEKPILRVVDFPAHAVRHVFNGLLQHGAGGNLSVLMEPLLRDVFLTDEELRYIDRDTRIRRKLTDYVRNGGMMEKPIATVEEDLAKLIGRDDVNDFAPLFRAHIPEEEVRRFLLDIPLDRSVQRAVSRFVQGHRFTPIQKLLEGGFRPASPRDWKEALPADYYDQFPPALWHLTEWEQFRSFAELSRQHSLDLSDFIKYAFYKGNEKLIRLGEDTRAAPTTTTTTTATPTLISTFYNASEVELLQRTRPWVEGFVSVLIEPVSGCDLYVGRPYNGSYYFPQDVFFRDLANQDVRQEHRGGKTLVLTHARSALPPAEMRVFHLLADGQILPQTRRVYEEGVRWIASGRARLTLPKVKEHMLSLPFEDLSPADQEVVLRKVRGDLTFFLSRVFDDELDLDAISSRLVDAALAMTDSFRGFLSHVFQLYFMLAPRYNMDVVSGVIRDRLNLFFYRLDSLCALPVEFYYPQFPFLADPEKESFRRWRQRCLDSFILETLASVFARNYPILRVRVPDHHSFTCSPPPKLIPVSAREKLALLHPHLNTFLYLPEVAASILAEEEYLVGGSPLPRETTTDMARFLDLDRVRAGLASLMMDNEYEVPTTLAVGTTTTTTTTTPAAANLELSGFRENAYRFLELLSQN